eukprot:1783813-Pleurochrysis_carterae.AAC.1
MSHQRRRRPNARLKTHRRQARRQLTCETVRASERPPFHKTSTRSSPPPSISRPPSTSAKALLASRIRRNAACRNRDASQSRANVCFVVDSG